MVVWGMAAWPPLPLTVTLNCADAPMMVPALHEAAGVTCKQRSALHGHARIAAKALPYDGLVSMSQQLVAARLSNRSRGEHTSRFSTESCYS